jgi:hypothetical protein
MGVGLTENWVGCECGRPQVPGLFPVAAVESESGPATVGSGAGRGGFAGRVLHSQDFDDGSSCRGKDVLVIGIGNSALDVVLDCVRHGARSIRVACRHSAVILPVSTADGKPIDAFFNSRRFAKAPKFLKTCVCRAFNLSTLSWVM